MSVYDNFICENSDDKCYHVKPFSKLAFSGTSPNTGKPFTQEEIKKITNHFFNSCSAKGGKVNYCCNPFETDASHTKLSNEMKSKYPYIKLNREKNKIKTIEVCNSTNLKDCPGKASDWKKPKSYEVCKMEGGRRLKGSEGVDTITQLRKDCYSMHCNPQEPEMSLSNFIGSASEDQDYTYYDDVNIADVIQMDSAQALIQDYMPKITNINKILTHNDRGETMLHVAIRHGSNKIVAFLVGKGANLNAQNILGDTPLHLAARFNKTNLAYALINYGADLNIENLKGEVPINDAVKDGSIEMLRVLFNHGGNIYQVNKDGDNLLHITIKFAVKDKAKKARFLVEKGVNITQKNNNGKSSIAVAEEMANEMEQDKNSNIVLEGFSCLTGFKQYEKHYDDDIPNILTYLQQVAYKQNIDKYDDYITGELPNSSYVEFDYNVCVGGKNGGQEQTKEECEDNGGQWKKYLPKSLSGKDLTHDYYYNTMKTKTKVEYPNSDEITLSQLKDKDLYRTKCNKPVYVKMLPHMTGELDLSPEDQNNVDNTNARNNEKNNNSLNNMNNGLNNINNATFEKSNLTSQRLGSEYNKNSINNIEVDPVGLNGLNVENPVIEGFEPQLSGCNTQMFIFFLFLIITIFTMKRMM